MGVFKKINGMDIVGQGGKIILFMLPSLVAAIWLNIFFPSIASLPKGVQFIKPIGYILLVPGLLMWGSAVILLLTKFPKGELVTTGAYGLVRNPIYASVIWFVLPGVSLITLTWVYLVAALFLFVGVQIFIKKEERQLLQVFGQTYQDYQAHVDRLIPFKKPRSK